ncbi:Fibronectin type III [Dillenia turbinata]|uniref:Fibronectin type III n=1 Tax=Dillenia turbinata TaxID=194707 RepID=A0AAN8ZPT1_9MAGN
MDLEDKFLARVSGVQSHSSSVQSTPEKNGHPDEASRSPELLQEFIKSGLKEELLRNCFEKEKKQSAKGNGKAVKNHESRKGFTNPKNQPSSRKPQRKGENPSRLLMPTEHSTEFGCSNSWICKNPACRANLSKEDTFCKRCSCCICHQFDENKDPSLWLVCSSESDDGDFCGLSCHIECALQRRKVGVVDLGQLMHLDGSYCCASCGKVSGLLGCWKKQLVIARDARRIDVLCHRIYLSHQLLDGTSRFKELVEIVKDARAKLEIEVGPLDGFSAMMARGIVSRLPIATDVQKLCSIAIDKADELLGAVSNASNNCREVCLPAACRFLFEEVTSTSVVIVLLETSSAISANVVGYKLWYCKSREEVHLKEPACVFPRAQRRVLISKLQPCTEYIFRIISYTEAGDLGHSEAKCFTKSVEIIHKSPNPVVKVNNKTENAPVDGGSDAKMEDKTLKGASSSGFKIRDLGKILCLAWAQEKGCFDGFCYVDVLKCCSESKVNIPETLGEKQFPLVSRELDLNVVSVPDLNEELTPPFETSGDEDIGCNLGQPVEADDDAISHGIDKNDGNGDSLAWTREPTEEVPATDSIANKGRKRAASTSEETHDCDSTLINGSPLRVSSGSGCLDENFEYCVKIIRWLEREGHIDREFRLKLLTWFSVRSTEQERRVVNTFIQTLIDDPSSLAGQLFDTFSEIISSKRSHNGFCGKLWH